MTPSISTKYTVLTSYNIYKQLKKALFYGVSIGGSETAKSFCNNSQSAVRDFEAIGPSSTGISYCCAINFSSFWALLFKVIASVEVELVIVLLLRLKNGLILFVWISVV